MEEALVPSPEVAQAVAELQPVFLALVRSLVDHPEAATLRVRSTWLETVFEFSVDETDIGKILGRHGRNARALRTLLSAASMKHAHHYTIDLPTSKQPGLAEPMNDPATKTGSSKQPFLQKN